jgi:DNA polymerase
MSFEDKVRRLRFLYKDIQVCEDCVLSKVDINNRMLRPFLKTGTSDVLFVSQNPSYYRKADLPNVMGGLDKLPSRVFEEILTKLGLKVEDIWVSNAVKCSCDHNSPLPLEVVPICGQKWLDKEIQIIQPRVIIALGDAVGKFFHSKNKRMTSEMLSYHNIPLFQVRHPLFAVRGGMSYDDYIKSFDEVAEFMKNKSTLERFVV